MDEARRERPPRAQEETLGPVGAASCPPAAGAHWTLLGRPRPRRRRRRLLDLRRRRRTPLLFSRSSQRVLVGIANVVRHGPVRTGPDGNGPAQHDGARRPAGPRLLRFSRPCWRGPASRPRAGLHDASSSFSPVSRIGVGAGRRRAAPLLDGLEAVDARLGDDVVGRARRRGARRGGRRSWRRGRDSRARPPRGASSSSLSVSSKFIVVVTRCVRRQKQLRLSPLRVGSARPDRRGRGAQQQAVSGLLDGSRYDSALSGCRMSNDL